MTPMQAWAWHQAQSMSSQPSGGGGSGGSGSGGGGSGVAAARPGAEEGSSRRCAANAAVAVAALTPASLACELRRLHRETNLAQRRQLFRELRLRWHPDKNRGNEDFAASMFRALEECKKWFLADD